MDEEEAFKWSFCQEWWRRPFYQFFQRSAKFLQKDTVLLSLHLFLESTNDWITSTVGGKLFSLEYEKIFWSKFEPTHIFNWKFTSFFSNEVKSFYSQNRTKLLGKFCQCFWIKIFHFKHHHSLVTFFLITWSKNQRVVRTIFW